MEICSGCGTVTEGILPYAGVGKDQETGSFEEFPICLDCWRDPAHRTAVLKFHFFQRNQAAQAVKDADNNILVSPPE